MPYEITSFTPLSEERIAEIIDNTRPELVSQVAYMAQQAQQKNPEYVNLINDYRALEGAEKKKYIETNQQKIAELLNDCGLMGYGNERSRLQHDNFVIGAEGMELILAYLKDKKGPNQRLHDVITVKNENLITTDGSQKHSNIFLQDPDHKALTQRLREDIAAAREKGEALEKTYLIEVFGTTGGNHGAMLTIRKEPGENAPLVHLFDPSPSLVRNGLEATQNSIACGWNAHLIISASVKKAFEAEGLQFDNNQYFNNSEPQQQRGYVYCGTFAYEEANRIASMTRKQHKKLLESYIYPSPFGGRTEIGSKNSSGEIEPINLDRVRAEGGYVKDPVLGLRGEEVIASQFVEPALSTRVAELSQIPHPRKEGRKAEFELDHVIRYQIKEGPNKGFNTMMEQKALRQKIGHLFEIVGSNQFLDRAGAVGLAPNPFDKASPYSPKSNASEKPAVEGAEGVIDVINFNLPPTNKINRASFDGKVCRISIFVGEITGQKIANFFSNNELKVEMVERDLSNNFPADIDRSLTKIREYVVEIPREKFELIEKEMIRINEKGQKEPAEQFYKANNNDSFYPKPRAEILGIGVSQLSGDQQNQL